MKSLANRVKGINTSGLRQMFELAKTLNQPLDLSLGMSDFPVPQFIKDSAIKAINSSFSGYTVNAGDPEVRRAVAKKLKKKNNIKATVDQIIITNGVTGGLLLALAAVLDPGDEIIIFDPYFVLYQQIVDFLGAQPIYLSTYPTWQWPWAELAKVVTAKTKAILVNNPNNPTGQVYNAEQLKLLADFAGQHDLIIISDEVYEEFVYAGSHLSMANFYPATITLMGSSKSAAMAGWRIGYLQAPEEIVQQMLKLQQIFYVCAPRPFQIALAASLNYDYSAIRKNYQRKNQLVKEMLGDYPGIKGAFYAFLPALNGDVESTVANLFKEKVLVVPGQVFSQQNSHFRISYSLPDRQLAEALTIIKRQGCCRPLTVL